MRRLCRFECRGKRFDFVKVERTVTARLEPAYLPYNAAKAIAVEVLRMKKAFILFLWCFIATLAQAQSSGTSSHGSEGLLLALENAWNQAQLHHDSKALAGLIADSFVSTDNDGVLTNKVQFLEDNRDPSYAPSLMTNSDERIFLYDNVAVVVGTYHAKGLYKGKPFDHYGRFTDTWVYMNGKWLCVASHTSPLKKGPQTT
jgi:hypothetical protein